MEEKKSGIKKFLEEFKAFAMRGNVLDMAVGVVIGGAFTAIVNSLVNDIINPSIGLFFNADFSDVGIHVGEVMIGISVQPVPVTAENGESALLVMEVTPGGPGEEAGIQKGDLIVAADGEALTKSTDLLRVRRRHEAGETLKVLVERDGKRFTADVVLRESDT